MSAPLEPTPYGPVLARRSVLVGALGLAGSALVGAPGAEAAPRVTGRIRETYLAAGGADVLGAPLHRQVKRTVDHVNTYAQHFERGTVWWGAEVGLVDRPGTRVRLASAPNFRPVSGVRDLWRTDDLDGCTPLEKRVVMELGVTTMIAMNARTDPSIPGVKRRYYPISNAGERLELYRGYVTRKDSRESVGRVLRRVARTEGAVIVHCKAGKDRTGWVCDLLQSVAGVPRDVRDLDYLATRTYSGGSVELEWLEAARTQLADDYGSVTDYLVDGCDVMRADLKRLAARLR